MEIDDFEIAIWVVHVVQPLCSGPFRFTLEEVFSKGSIDESYHLSRSLSDLRLFGPKSIILGVCFALIINFNRLQGFSGGRIFANSVSPTGS